MVWTKQATLQGPAGPAGPTGATGPQGPQGDPGTSYTNEEAQDAVGAILVDTATIDLTYNDATPSITAAVVAGSIGTTQLGNDQITYAKIQNVTDARLLGRSAGSAGDAQEITVSTGLSLSAGVLSNTVSAGQPLDALLTALAALVTAADQTLYFTGVDAPALTALTAVARTLLAATTQAAQRTALGLGTVSTQDYTESTFTATMTGCTAVITGTAFYVRVGKQVTVHLPNLSGTSNATTMTITGWPAGFAPIANVYQWGKVVDNGVNQGGMIQFLSSGVCNVFPNAAFGTWTASGTKALAEPVLTYRAA